MYFISQDKLGYAAKRKKKRRKKKIPSIHKEQRFMCLSQYMFIIHALSTLSTLFLCLLPVHCKTQGSEVATIQNIASDYSNVMVVPTQKLNICPQNDIYHFCSKCVSQRK